MPFLTALIKYNNVNLCKMSKAYVFLFLCCLYNLVLAQQRAITNRGEEVILYEDGTWEYAEQATDTADAPIATNPTPFTKSQGAGFMVESTIVDDVEVAVDPEKWRFQRTNAAAAAEYKFEHKSKPLYAMLIAEEMEIPINLLKKAALSNARDAAEDARITYEEYRVVNGQTMLMMEIKGTIEGMPFAYLGYYYSGSTGTIQLISYTTQNFFEQNKSELEEFLNGLVVR
ncbi:hypothetical protein C7N43_05265 [Sphingobacteriales bacterium UPWRP_1]|nr:hypothetical protein BVG80_09755 [Sphingobacteriales bacterium TSM_CSM]PSJ78112.1 hypothetical protein C7N43_05265 [Sphingobacteriales bacterium UPWRP_1]